MRTAAQPDAGARRAVVVAIFLPSTTALQYPIKESSIFFYGDQ